MPTQRYWPSTWIRSASLFALAARSLPLAAIERISFNTLSMTIGIISPSQYSRVRLIRLIHLVQDFVVADSAIVLNEQCGSLRATTRIPRLYFRPANLPIPRILVLA